MGSSQETIERASRLVGKMLRDKWRLDALIGVGGMASVYSATHRNGKRAAIKLLNRDLSEGDSTRARFLREGYVANKVGHPGVVSVLDDDTSEDGRAYLVMELLEGETLKNRWTRWNKHMPADEVLRVTYAVLDVLVAAHDKGIIHRDIKPDNIFLTNDGAVKVLDFGIARLRETGEAADATRSSAMLGTPAFMAPEQARSRWEWVDARTDIWAVGATMFTSLTGHFVHQSVTVTELLVTAATMPARPVRQLMPELPEGIAGIIDRALAFEQAQRWPDAKAMQTAIGYALQSKGPASYSTQPMQQAATNPMPTRIFDGYSSGVTPAVVVPPAPQSRPGMPSQPESIDTSATPALVPRSVLLVSPMAITNPSTAPLPEQRPADAPSSNPPNPGSYTTAPLSVVPISDLALPPTTVFKPNLVQNSPPSQPASYPNAQQPLSHSQSGRMQSPLQQQLSQSQPGSMQSPLMQSQPGMMQSPLASSLVQSQPGLMLTPMPGSVPQPGMMPEPPGVSTLVTAATGSATLNATRSKAKTNPLVFAAVGVVFAIGLVAAIFVVRAGGSKETNGDTPSAAASSVVPLPSPNATPIVETTSPVPSASPTTNPPPVDSASADGPSTSQPRQTNTTKPRTTTQTTTKKRDPFDKY